MLRVQACGDCHLMNFGGFATPERRAIFDINDMDESLPAPWEWDVKRLAASFVLACRNFASARTRARHRSGLRPLYRERMTEYSRMSALEVRYSSIDVKKVMASSDGRRSPQAHPEARAAAPRAQRARSTTFPKLAAPTAGVGSWGGLPP